MKHRAGLYKPEIGANPVIASGLHARKRACTKMFIPFAAFCFICRRTRGGVALAEAGTVAGSLGRGGWRRLPEQSGTGAWRRAIAQPDEAAADGGCADETKNDDNPRRTGFG
jgi:hypothetical protein